MASLADPLATLKRARKDLAALKERVETLRHTGEREFVNLEPDRKISGRWHYKLPNAFKDVSTDVGVIAGMLRSILDQLVFALFELHNGHPPPAKRRTQFPICQAPNDFCSRIKPDLEGLAVEHIVLIRQLQPYNGGHWLTRLKSLAEEHKHKKLIFLKAEGIPGGSYRARATDPTNLDTFHTFKSGVKAPKSMYVDSYISGTITLADGTPIIDTLEILQAQVSSVIDSFKPLFDS
jgi:hypothetical protein